MIQLEQENSILLTEIKHLAKVDKLTSGKDKPDLQTQEKIIKSHKTTIKRLTVQL